MARRLHRAKWSSELGYEQMRLTDQQSLESSKPRGVGSMSRVLLSILLTLSTYAFCQTQQAIESVAMNTLPDAPSATSAIYEGASAGTSQLRSLGNPSAALVIQTLPPAKPKATIDRSFALLTLFQVLSSVADVESTQYGLSHGAREENPMFGSHPTRAVQYAISLPMSAGVATLSYMLKKRAPQSRHWIIPQVVYGSIHAGAAAHNMLLVSGD